MIQKNFLFKISKEPKRGIKPVNNSNSEKQSPNNSPDFILKETAVELENQTKLLCQKREREEQPELEVKINLGIWTREELITLYTCFILHKSFRVKWSNMYKLIKSRTKIQIANKLKNANSKLQSFLLFFQNNSESDDLLSIKPDPKETPIVSQFATLKLMVISKMNEFFKSINKGNYLSNNLNNSNLNSVNSNDSRENQNDTNVIKLSNLQTPVKKQKTDFLNSKQLSSGNSYDYIDMFFARQSSVKKPQPSDLGFSINKKFTSEKAFEPLQNHAEKNLNDSKLLNESLTIEEAQIEENNCDFCNKSLDISNSKEIINININYKDYENEMLNHSNSSNSNANITFKSLNSSETNNKNNKNEKSQKLKKQTSDIISSAYTAYNEKQLQISESSKSTLKAYGTPTDTIETHFGFNSFNYSFSMTSEEFAQNLKFSLKNTTRNNLLERNFLATESPQKENEELSLQDFFDNENKLKDFLEDTKYINIQTQAIEQIEGISHIKHEAPEGIYLNKKEEIRFGDKDVYISETVLAEYISERQIELCGNFRFKQN